MVNQSINDWMVGPANQSICLPEICVLALGPGLNSVQQDVGRHQLRGSDHFQQILEPNDVKHECKKEGQLKTLSMTAHFLYDLMDLHY